MEFRPRGMLCRRTDSRNAGCGEENTKKSVDTAVDEPMELSDRYVDGVR